MLVTIATCGRRDERVSSWKLETSITAMSSKPASSAMPVTGEPALPHTNVFSPAARKISSSMATVVVLPLVPVTATNAARRDRQPSSASPTMRLPARRKRRGSSPSMGTPGLSTSTSLSSQASASPSFSTHAAPPAWRARTPSLP